REQDYLSLHLHRSRKALRGIGSDGWIGAGWIDDGAVMAEQEIHPRSVACGGSAGRAEAPYGGASRRDHALGGIVRHNLIGKPTGAAPDLRDINRFRREQRRNVIERISRIHGVLSIPQELVIESR